MMMMMMISLRKLYVSCSEIGLLRPHDVSRQAYTYVLHLCISDTLVLISRTVEIFPVKVYQKFVRID